MHNSWRLNAFLGKEVGQRLPRLVSGTSSALNQTLPHPFVSSFSESLHMQKNHSTNNLSARHRHRAEALPEASGGVRGSPVDPGRASHIRGCKRRITSSVTNSCRVCPRGVEQLCQQTTLWKLCFTKPTGTVEDVMSCPPASCHGCSVAWSFIPSYCSVDHQPHP